jgi:hypothetical protein
MTEWTILTEDIQILRDLLLRMREFSQLPVMAERKRLWTAHAALKPERPMILAETMGVLNELVPEATLRCQAGWARSMERGLRDLVYRCQSVDDDYVVEPYISIPWDVAIGDYGLATEMEYGHNEGKLASYHWTPPLQDLDRDFDRLHFRSLRVDRDTTFTRKDFLTGLFGDILPVRIRGSYWWTSGLTWEAIKLIGMENLMLAMYDNPAGLHRLMSLLSADFLHMLDWFEAEGLLTLNNEDDYVGSGSIGYTSELPGSGWQPGSPVTARQLWGLSESQETVGVSPRLFAEFILPYQMPIISRFGLVYYGCCEPIHTRIKYLNAIPNLRRVSVSPWCDQEIMARECASRLIFCRKPSPTLVSTGVMDEDQVRQDLRTTLHIAGGGALELVMKDVHTLNNEPARLGRWVALARQEIEDYLG